MIIKDTNGSTVVRNVSQIVCVSKTFNNIAQNCSFVEESRVEVFSNVHISK